MDKNKEQIENRMGEKLEQMRQKVMVKIIQAPDKRLHKIDNVT